MPQDSDWCIALNELVNAIYDCTRDDPDWDFKQTKKSTELRASMTDAVNKIAFGLLDRTLTPEEVDQVLDWESHSD